MPGEPFASITAEPTGALNREREVLLVWHRQARDVGPENEDGEDALEDEQGAAQQAEGAETPSQVAEQEQ